MTIDDPMTNDRQPPRALDDGLEMARELIREAKEERSPVLNLGCLELKEVPDEVRELTWLRELNLAWQYWSPSAGKQVRSKFDYSPNEISRLPPWLKDLAGLESLGVEWTVSLADVSQLRQLKYLCVRGPIGDQEWAPLASLTELRLLEIDGRDQRIDLGILEGMTHLESLAICHRGEFVNVPSLIHCVGLKHVDLGGCIGVTRLDFLAGATQLETLCLSNCDALASLAGLAEMTSLRELNLSRCSGFTDLDALAGLKVLEKLNLYGCVAITNADGLAGLSQLQSLDMSECDDLDGVEFLSGLVGLESLRFANCRGLKDSAVFERMGHLRTLNISGCDFTEVRGLASLGALEEVDLRKCEKLTSLEGLSDKPALASLKLSHCKALSSLDGLSGCSSLQEFDFSGCVSLTNFRGLADMVCLRQLYLNGCESLSSLDGIQGISGLESLRLSGCRALVDIDALAELTALATVELQSCTSLRSVALLVRLPNLRTLRLANCKALEDLSCLSAAEALLTLEVSGSPALTSANLGELPNLRTLVLRRCDGIRDLSGLAGLRSLTTLQLAGCRSLANIDALAGLHDLETVDLTNCKSLARFPDFFLNAPALKSLFMSGAGVRDLPVELLGSYSGDDCLAAVRAHFADLKRGPQLDREVKLIVLGNGRVGKTSLCRRLIEGRFDPAEVSTHGVKFWTWALRADGGEGERIDVNVWDFGGQDIYLGTHAMFLRGRAVFLIAWDQVTENTPEYHDPESGLEHRNHLLQYWVDYVNHASPGSPIIIVQTKCDADAHRPRIAELRLHEGRINECWFQASDHDLALGNGHVLLKLLEGAATTALGLPEAQVLGAGRWGVKQAIRTMVAAGEPKTITPAEFTKLCAEHGIDDPEAVGHLLAYLHNSGVLYHRHDLFEEAVVLDQRWACDAIYTVTDRRECGARIRAQDGRFTASDLARWSWSDRTEQERALFLRMMQTCGICIYVGSNGKGEGSYLAPELSPPKEEVEHLFDWPSDGETLWWRYEFDFLGPATMRSAMCDAGGSFRATATYWQDGFHYAVKDTAEQAIVEAEYRVGGNPSRGRITIQVRGPERSQTLLLLREFVEGPRRYWGRHQRNGMSTWIACDGVSFVRASEDDDEVSPP